MSFLQSLAKSGSSSNSNKSTQNSHIWADRLTNDASSSSSQQHQDFRTPIQQSSSLSAGEAEYASFLGEKADQGSSSNTHFDGDTSAVGPYSLLPPRESTSSTFKGVDHVERTHQYSDDVEFQKSIDGMDVVGLLEVMDTQETEMDAFAIGRGGEKALDNGAEVEDPVEWLDTTNEYTDEVWGEGEPDPSKGKMKVVEQKNKGKGKGKGKAVDMKSRL
ncbi:hypothetical protein Dda_6727 [Drechslerella dactyloides]|uniref:Uncharacterized protein n=1 Tax=Drechslerella dactyloides TaxID=74499 RepID=A0AAD6IVE4_DREDA|nr:hypothetical protein Dda_6727 [Drechslerella dactyloides]